MKQFNLEEAKAGKPVCTRNGHPARIICFDKKYTGYNIVALIDFGNEECVANYTTNGRYYDNEDESDNDLFMCGEKHTGYVNIWKNTENILECGYVFESEEEAINSANNCVLSYKKHIATIKIEWED